jgi:hypothetical protein
LKRRPCFKTHKNLGKDKIWSLVPKNLVKDKNMVIGTDETPKSRFTVLARAAAI